MASHPPPATSAPFRTDNGNNSNSNNNGNGSSNGNNNFHNNNNNNNNQNQNNYATHHDPRKMFAMNDPRRSRPPAPAAAPPPNEATSASAAAAMPAPFSQAPAQALAPMAPPPPSLAASLPPPPSSLPPSFSTLTSAATSTTTSITSQPQQPLQQHLQQQSQAPPKRPIIQDDDDDEDDDIPIVTVNSNGSSGNKKRKIIDDDDDDDDDDDHDDDALVDTDDDDDSPHQKQKQKQKQRPMTDVDPYSTTTTTTTTNTNTILKSQEDDIPTTYKDQLGEAIPVHDDVEFIDEVEWATDDTKQNGELAPKPRPDPMGDPCGCTAPAFDFQAALAIANSSMENSPTASPTPPLHNSQPQQQPQHSQQIIQPLCCMDPSCILFACQEECRSNCEAGRFCGNKRIQRKEWKPVEVFHAGPKGRGLRLLQDVTKGDFLLEYVGRAVRASYLSKLFQRYRQERRLYIMALDANVYLDARKKGSVARYINHSCQPNCVVERWKVRGIIRAGIFALRDMKAGEELSFDYQWERQKGRAPTKCYCGAPNCRGTLEVPKSLEEEEYEKSSEGHWKVMGGGTKHNNNNNNNNNNKQYNPARDIINRTIRILSKEYQQYFYADVCGYDEATRTHQVIYSHNREEVWEDLAQEEWQILDEDAADQDDYVIAKKRNWVADSNHRNNNDGLLARLGGLAAAAGSSSSGKVADGSLKGIRPYLYVQTPIKEAFWAKHLIQRCERNCRVTISAKQFARPPALPDPNDPEDVEKHKALDESFDGTVWKLSITGYDVPKACTILEKNVAYLTKKQQQQQGQSLAAASSLSTILGDTTKSATPGGLKKFGAAGAGGLLTLGNRNLSTTNIPGGAAATSGAITNTISIDNRQEVVMPRCIVDNFKKRLPLVREKCRSVNISFVHSESKSKQIAKIVLEATLQSDMFTARESVWSQLLAACAEINAPKTPTGLFFRDLGFMGGELTGEQFRLLLQHDETSPTAGSSSSGGENHRLPITQGCREDLRRVPFFASFESTQRCTVWVQSEEDKGRIDGSNNIVGEATPNSPRKVFFGCDHPKDIQKLWTLVQTRASEVARGVKYLYLGADRVYQPFMMQNGGRFFDYVKRVTGASVMVDHMTGDHLRIDGRSYLVVHTSTADNVIDLENEFSETERVALAEEMIRLQIEIYRDHCIRQQNWIFGRDWTLAKISTTDSFVSDSTPSGGGKPPAAGSARLQFDEKAVANACQEIAEITAALGSSVSIGASAAIMFYRFVTLVCLRDDYDSQLKVREIVLGCVFLANKAQKVNKWRRLDAVLEAAYQVFYPGALFDGSKEEVLILGEKVLLAETEILHVLDFDVFWRGTEWILAAAIEGAGLEASKANEALEVACSGPVLAAGSTLWLKYGVEYVFAAAAGFLDANLQAIFPALALIPLKVFQAAELIAESVKLSSSSKRGSTHALFDGGKESLLRHIPRIKDVCVKSMAFGGFGQQRTTINSSETEQRYRLIGSRDCRRHAIRGVRRSVMRDAILPIIDGASAESKCNIYIGESAVQDSDDIVFEGSWRAIAIAEHLLRASAMKISPNALPPSEDISVELEVMTKNKLQAKVHPGLLSMKNVNTSDGWNETIQSEVSGASVWGRKTGGKICVAGKLAASSLREVGLRWWIPPQHGPSPTGSICDMFLVRFDPDNLLGGLRRLARSFLGESESFPMLACPSSNGTKTATDRFVAVSLQRWPSEKVETRELEKSKKSKGSNGMGMGFSAAALQEMQLLNELHSVIPSPQGHPNFVLPVALALPSDEEEEEEEKVEKEVEPAASTVADDIFSLFRTSEENEKAARREKKLKDFVTGPHVVFQPSPFVLQRFMSKKKRKGFDEMDEKSGIGPAIFSAWFHDLLSALVHCHTNHVIVRTFQSDQVIIDHSGVAKLGGLYRATVISPEDRNVVIDPLKAARAAKKDFKKDKKKRSADDDDDVASNPYIAPEHLLGLSKHTKESDVWSLGCLLANVLLNKTLYSGKDRQGLLNNMYKVVGVPARDNYEVACKLPYYSKPIKKYKRGVEKAINHILKEDSEMHAGAVDLLAKMLHLDPAQRITAVEALRHHYMLDYIENSNSDSFRRRFVDDWMALKGKLMISTQTQEDEARVRERILKRKAVLLAASTGAKDTEQDDLYNLDELFASADSGKKPKF